VQRHAVFDAAGHVKAFDFGVDHKVLSLLFEMQGQHGVLPIKLTNP
jgi:hypothetical protein